MKARTFRRVQWRDEAGFGLIEVLVSAVVLVLVATATVSSIASSQKQSARTLARGITANLAEQDQERMRSFRATDLIGYEATRTVVQENVSYKVDSDTSFVAGSSDQEVSCTSSGEQSRYIQLATTVTPQASLQAKPMTVTSLYALPIAQFSPTSGTLIVQVYARDGITGQPDIPVSVTGPESRSSTTNEKGCAIFQFLTPGSYSVKVAKTGYVDQGMSDSITLSGTVSPATINQTTPAIYDLAGSITATFNGSTTMRSPGITISNSGLLNGTSRSFTSRKVPDPSTQPGPFPFVEPYHVYSGTCATKDGAGNPLVSANDPTTWEPTFYTAHPTIGVAAVGPGASVTVDVHEPEIRTVIQAKRTTGSGTATTTGSVAGMRVYLRQSDANCGTVTYATTTKADGSLTDARYPYGNYYLCAEYDKTSGSGTNGTYYGLDLDVRNRVFSGVSRALTVDSTNTGYKTTCASLG